MLREEKREKKINYNEEQRKDGTLKPNNKRLWKSFRPERQRRKKETCFEPKRKEEKDSP